MPWLSNGLRRFDVEEGSPAFERLKKQGYEEETDLAETIPAEPPATLDPEPPAVLGSVSDPEPPASEETPAEPEVPATAEPLSPAREKGKG